MEEEYKYRGVFCTSYIPWVFLFPITAISLYKTNIYLSGLALAAAFITIILLVRCKIKCPANIVVINNNKITINFPKEQKIIDIDAISSIELKANKIIMQLTNNEVINIPSGYWQTTNDMKYFISIISNTKPNNTFKRDAIKRRAP